ncbi:phosphoserine transaminase [Magnetospira sp. QH-2]|uniref:phosphoserine transaminase n=1 Tax=Magnetospira sp. (strain QH-2) TaxID=1288970 RepID=UPI0003E81343|nr:phosphoserine transaminase [Magnetospira sp. QH-2]CCQ73287.1 Phosphoserine aminotransferase [Magnetospira sp. QH-2]
MNTVAKPDLRPDNPNFSSGPCSKRPGWTIEALSGALVGRSHRAKPAKARIKQVIDQSKAILGVPDDYVLGIVPASDTGAVEMALWSMLGERGVDMLVWESFGKGWATDVTKQLKLDDVRVMEAGYGELPDLGAVDFARDVVFTWNGTTSGVKVPNGDWIPSDREGLTFCDATSAAFAMDLPWDKLDVTTYSWQKVLGGEAQHGILVLSPRAVARLESYSPDRPLPKIFRMTKGDKLIGGIFQGATINTVSMIAIEDAVDGLTWAESVGGLKGMIGRSTANLKVIEDFVTASGNFGFLAKDAATRSNTSVCLNITAPWFTALSDDDQAAAAKKLVGLLDEEGAAYDIGAYRDAPAGLRIWAGGTIEAADLEALCPWLEWGLAEIQKDFS